MTRRRAERPDAAERAHEIVWYSRWTRARSLNLRVRLHSAQTLGRGVTLNKGKSMQIEFRRIGERRYAVVVYRQDGSVLEMNPAAGYDPLMPHDLLHYVVERELGLRSGIFGQLASGGNAGTFHEVPQQGAERRDVARRRKRLSRRGETLLKRGRDDSSASEDAVAMCLQAWVTRRKEQGGTGGTGYRPVGARRHDVPPYPATKMGIAEVVLERILDRLDVLSAQWSALEVGESVRVDWPDDS